MAYNNRQRPPLPHQAARGAARQSGSTSEYDEASDEILAKFSTREGDQGVAISLRSYKGSEPRVKIVRWFKGREGWKPDLTAPIPRLRWQVVRWLLQSMNQLDKGYEEWQRTHRKPARTGGRGGRGGDDPFGR
jgi:hypothetical protein